MAREIGTISDARWPDGVRLPVMLTFEHQSGEGTPPLPGDRPNYMMGGALEYGGRTRHLEYPRIARHARDQGDVLRVRHHGGEISRRRRAAHKAGHEIAGMSYSFERVRTASVAREQGDRAQDRARC